jgi:excisionase family DNA binding protein
VVVVTSPKLRRGGLDQCRRAERQSAAAITGVPGSLGGSNHLLTVEEVADYLGVPKKTVYACWRGWGLRGYRIGRHLRFRVRHVEEWLERQEAAGP